MRVRKTIGCVILGFTMGIILSILLHVPNDMGWIAGMICVNFTAGLLLIFYE